MAKKSKIVKNTLSRVKHENRYRRRCNRCGRPRSVMRFVGLCRLCFREKANRAELPGVTKASW